MTASSSTSATSTFRWPRQAAFPDRQWRWQFQVAQGEAVGIVGESGCGKSTTARAIMGTLPTPPTRIDRGSIAFNGHDLLRLNRDELENGCAGVT